MNFEDALRELSFTAKSLITCHIEDPENFTAEFILERLKEKYFSVDFPELDRIQNEKLAKWKEDVKNYENR